MLLPANIQFATHPKLVMAKPGVGEVELNWLSCNPGACLATASLADDMLATLSAQTDPGRAVFHDSTDREIAIVISFRGLAQASGALAKD